MRAGDRVARVLAPVTTLLPAALFSAIVVLMTVADDSTLVIDARLAGVAVAIVAVIRRAPFAVAVALAMLATAGIRLLS